MDPEFVSRLLVDDETGQTVKFIAGAFARQLVKVYHPDSSDMGGDSNRFEQVRSAADRISGASIAALGRWATGSRPSGMVDAERYRAERDDSVRRAVELHEYGLEHARHPDHFRHFTDAKGLLLHGRGKFYLARPDGDQTIKLTPAQRDIMTVMDGDMPEDVRSKDISDFLVANGLFDTTPGAIRQLFLDGAAGLRLYDADFNYVGDADVALRKKLDDRQHATGQARRALGWRDLWSRREHPSIITIATTADGDSVEVRNVLEFVERMRPHRTRSTTELTRHLPLAVVGSTGEDFAERMMRAPGGKQREALPGAGPSARLLIRLASFATGRLFEYDAAYTPLLTAGNTLMLRQQNATQTAIATDAKIAAFLR